MIIGKLIVFEGPDGTGKSTLSRELLSYLRAKGLECHRLAFPGEEAGTLGELVYKLHHTPQQLGISAIDPTSLQLLHVAAHIDTIEKRILPALRAGTWVILDRYWWSTWVYGRVLGANHRAVDQMVALERFHWAESLPVISFLVTRPNPMRKDYPLDTWLQLDVLYRQLAVEQRIDHPVEVIDSNLPFELSYTTVLDHVIQLLPQKLFSPTDLTQ